MGHRRMFLGGLLALALCVNAACMTVDLTESPQQAEQTLTESAQTGVDPFQASQHIAEIIHFVDNFDMSRRTLQILDFYAGTGTLARRATHKGYRGPNNGWALGWSGGSNFRHPCRSWPSYFWKPPSQDLRLLLLTCCTRRERTCSRAKASSLVWGSAAHWRCYLHV